MAKKEKKKSGKGLIIIIVILILVIVLGGVGGFLFIKSMSGDKVKEVSEQVLVLEEAIVNIKDPSMKRYAKYTLAITYDENDKDVLEDINSNIYKIKDGIIAIFQGKTVSDIESSEGIEAIKSEIKEKIDSILEDNTVLSVYFTNLLVH